MADFNKDEAQKFQSEIIERVQETERMLDRDVIEYYTSDRVDSEEDYYENLRGLHKFLKEGYFRIGQLLSDIERRID